jgi:HEAT repeat protein
MPPASPEASLRALFDAERAVRAAHEALAREDADRVMPTLQRAVREAAGLDEDEASLRLVRLASVVGEFEGPAAVDLLIDILGSDAPEARHEAGEELSAHAWERFKEVALGVERALDRLPHDNPALLELPYILAEIPEPGVLRLLGRFLVHANVEVVASAVEALVETGDLECVAMLQPLVKDTRSVQLEDEGGTEAEATIGELASEAIEVLQNASRVAGRGAKGAP